jgi:egghead protein (zeste-white 4 protein)
LKIEKTKKPHPTLILKSCYRVYSETVKPEWAIGPLTKHRFVALMSVVIFTAIFYSLQEWLWPSQRPAVSLLEKTWTIGHYLWLAGAPMCTLMIVGIMLYRKKPLINIAPIPNQVVWRIVTLGQNVTALLYTISRIQESMARLPLFPYVIEVITESGVLEENVVPILSGNVQFLHVPANYVTEHKTRFKARALHYAVEHSPVPDDAWLVHLDEETCPTDSGVLGIARMIAEEEASGQLRIGQGAILYHRQWKKFPFLTLADNARTGMDFGPFYLQSQISTSIFGFHGSYIVIRNDVEKECGGFDLGQAGDITEDAWWILIANAKGFKIRWLDGFLEEQSTQSPGFWKDGFRPKILGLTIWIPGPRDFIKQRARWTEGLIKVVRYAPVPLWRRMSLGINLLLWGIVCLSVLYSVAHLFYGFDTNPWIRQAANWSWATCSTMYIIGLQANLDGAGITNPLKRLWWIVLQAILMPVFCLLEIVSGLFGLLYPQNGFHVVKK